LFLIDAAALPASDFQRVCILFDGRDEDALRAARRQWKEVKAKGWNAAYWQENEASGWDKVQ
jgi:DNA polymerase III subunit chi